MAISPSITVVETIATLQGAPAQTKKQNIRVLQNVLKIILAIVTKVVLGAAAMSAFAIVVGQPGLPFFAALSAMFAILYLASASDADGVRDIVSLVVPSLFVWGILLINHQNPILIGLTLFTHVLQAFFSGFLQSSGSFKDLRLWPVLFGVSVAQLVWFVSSNFV